MFALFRAKRIWIANEFTIASENSALDLLNADGSPKPARDDALLGRPTLAAV
jgi:hypothetical protein